MTEYGSCPAFGYECEYVAKVEAQAAEIEYWKTEARNVRRELKSEQKRADSAMDNYDAIHRRCEAQAAEIEKLQYELRCIFSDYRGYMDQEWVAAVLAALGETE
jgi:hypothetical protein